MLGKYNAGYRYKLVITLLDKKYIVDQLYAQICILLYTHDLFSKYNLPLGRLLTDVLILIVRL